MSLIVLSAAIFTSLMVNDRANIQQHQQQPQQQSEESLKLKQEQEAEEQKKVDATEERQRQEEEWKKEWDNDTQKFYEWNTITKKSRWVQQEQEAPESEVNDTHGILDYIIGKEGDAYDFGLYDYQFLDTRARELVRKHERSSRSVVLVIPNFTKQNFSVDEIKQHLRIRLPAKFNGFDKAWLKMYNLKKVLLYTYEEAESLQRPPRLRYSIVGDAHVSDGGKKVYVIHTWGVNLESKNTEDGRYVFNEKGEFSFGRYKELLGLMSECIFKGVDWINTKEKKVTMRVTKLGFGAWSDKLPHNYESTALDEYRKLLFKGAKERKSWLTVLLVDYPQSRTYNLSQSNNLDNLVVAEYNHDPFGASRPLDDGVLCFVNAWDLQTFIGNGGSRDQSLDGWMVNGGSRRNYLGIHKKRLGHYFVNDSFLHNIFFNPSLLNHENWI